jgi:hypothetical protein
MPAQPKLSLNRMFWMPDDVLLTSPSNILDPSLWNFGPWSATGFLVVTSAWRSVLGIAMPVNPAKFDYNPFLALIWSRCSPGMIQDFEKNFGEHLFFA